MLDADWFFADRFGWPPLLVDEQPVARLDVLREVTLLVEDIRTEQARDG